MREWRQGELFQALTSKDMGAVVRAYRHHHSHGRKPLTQAELARYLGITQGQLSRIENGRNRIRDLDTLSRYAQRLHIPAALLWFDLDLQTPPRPPSADRELVRIPGGKVIPAATDPIEPGLTDSLLAQLEQYAATDMAVGPHPLVPLVEQQMAFVDQLLSRSSNRNLDRLLYVSARYAELMGWLQQDAGDLSAAMAWSNTALDLAEERGDVCLLSYLRMRKSNIASDAGKPELAIRLADAALSNPAALTPRLQAVALRQQAHGHAVTGDFNACTRALERAHELAAEDVHDNRADMAGYCTTGYIAMEAAHCWVELGRPETALHTLQNGLSEWQPGSRRDLGVGLARLATAHADLGEPDDALEVARHALAILADTRSSRTASQLRCVARKLTRHGEIGHARELQHQLRLALRLPERVGRNTWT
ncbi:transcriptional regulator with XRE-family HTH domain [Nocardia kruczakiae]|uniref:Transcriptional regulator with XRE-family HTH domain n=1 Tax=Nocardia kruczakiae TaxID=261477 RepID=A0ABU1XMI3_9NOCA|nr:helix-turn-helix transcriptional regulator [Nocardia kruczakiae]MDR7171765.1 transcriptional regulator with XRE-family HTH domain [Nocardia kruczakiae]